MMRQEPRSARGVDVLATIGIVLLAVEGLFLIVGLTILRRRFGTAILWDHPAFFVPVVAMAGSAAAALEAIVRKRGETMMIIHCVTTLVVAVGVAAHVAHTLWSWFGD